MRHLLLVLALLAPTAVHSFASPWSSPPRARDAVRSYNGGDGGDPTKVWYAEIANVVQNVLTNSPLNEGKKAMVKAMAGDYDVDATRAKLQGLVDDSPVLMLSFTT